jgi:hypothetical protein
MTLFYSLTFETFLGPGPRIYIPQEQGGPVINPVTAFPFSRLLRLTGGRFRNLLQAGMTIDCQSVVSVKLLLAFASTVIPGFSLLEICTCFEMGPSLRRRRGRQSRAEQ